MGNPILKCLKDALTDEINYPYRRPKALERVMLKAAYVAGAAGMPWRKNERRLASFHNRHKGERCFLLANGPSLVKSDLAKLEGEITFGVNGLFLLQEQYPFLPTYYVVEDTLVAEDRKQEIAALKGPTKFFGNYLDYCLDDAEDIIWTNVMFRYDEYPDFPNFSTHAGRCMWTGGTVMYLCLQLAYYMGFTDVYLIGFDHSYAKPADVKTEGLRWTLQSDDPNHFDPSYFGKGYRWHDPNVERMEQCYRKAAEYFAKDGRRIFNATEGGKLEVFPRVSFESLFPAS